VDVVDRDGGAVRAEVRDGDIAQPDGLFDQRAGGIVFAQEVAGFVVGVEGGAVGAAADLNPLAEGVVEGGLPRLVDHVGRQCVVRHLFCSLHFAISNCLGLR
jgi:hypothetical protein